MHLNICSDVDSKIYIYVHTRICVSKMIIHINSILYVLYAIFLKYIFYMLYIFKSAI